MGILLSLLMLKSYTIGNDGNVSYVPADGGEPESAGQIQLAVFANPEGLLKTGANLYQVTANSGEAVILPKQQEQALSKVVI